MNEEEKMLLGELYNSSDEQLVNKLIRAKKLCNKYNKLDVEDIEKRNEIIRELFSKVGNNVWFGGNVCVIPGITIGDNTVIGAGSVVTKDIPANVVAVGNPCKVIKKV